jgi:hypothetical protein
LLPRSISNRLALLAVTGSDTPTIGTFRDHDTYRFCLEIAVNIVQDNRGFRNLRHSPR